MNNPNRNNSAINGANGQSPYRVSMASRNDGRPPTRPITPIKSAQAARYPHQMTASNNSAVTNSMIGQGDESAISNQFGQLALKQQVSAPMNKGQTEEMNATEENVPSELRSRPMIPRTPADGEQRPHFKQD